MISDIDECAVTSPCLNGKCLNTPGSYKCECNKGFESSRDGTTCYGILKIF